MKKNDSVKQNSIKKLQKMQESLRKLKILKMMVMRLRKKQKYVDSIFDDTPFEKDFEHSYCKMIVKHLGDL